MTPRPLALLVLLLGSLLAAPAARAHPLHTAHADLEVNRTTGRLEIAVRLIADDVLAALNAGRATPLTYEKTPAADLDAALLRYVTDRLALTPAGASAPVTLAWVGRETDAEGPHQRLWVYLEAPTPATLAGARVRFAVLLDTQPRQENTARLRDGARDITLAFDAEHDTRLVPAAATP